MQHWWSLTEWGVRCVFQSPQNKCFLWYSSYISGTEPDFVQEKILTFKPAARCLQDNWIWWSLSFAAFPWISCLFPSCFHWHLHFNPTSCLFLWRGFNHEVQIALMRLSYHGIHKLFISDLKIKKRNISWVWLSVLCVYYYQRVLQSI